MTLRIDSLVSHGYVDNRLRDEVTIRLWLVGRSTPITLHLEGNALQDVAGAFLTFRNKKPCAHAPAWVNLLEEEQEGMMGDLTASRRVPVVDLSKQQATWHNVLSLEWFSPEYGRLLLESTHYEAELSDRQWEMDLEEEAAQKMINLCAFREYISACLGNRPDFIPPPYLKPFVSPSSKKKTARIMETYREVCQKYGLHLEAESHRAYVMGWDHVLHAMAVTEETGEPFFFAEAEGDFPFTENDELSEEVEMRVCRGNPLYEKIQHFALYSHCWISSFFENITEENSPQYEFLKGIYVILEKISLVLVRLSRGEPDKERLLVPLEESIQKALQVSALMTKLPEKGKEALVAEIQEEWSLISKNIAKLKFKVTTRS